MSIHEKLAQVQREGKGLTERLKVHDALLEFKEKCGMVWGGDVPKDVAEKADKDSGLNLAVLSPADHPALYETVLKRKNALIEASDSTITARRCILDSGIIDILLENADILPPGTMLEVTSWENKKDPAVGIVFKWDSKKEQEDDWMGTRRFSTRFKSSWKRLTITSNGEGLRVSSAYFNNDEILYYGQYYPEPYIPSRTKVLRDIYRDYFSVVIKNDQMDDRERVEAAIVDALYEAGIRAPEPRKTKDKPKLEAQTDELEIRITRTT